MKLIDWALIGGLSAILIAAHLTAGELGANIALGAIAVVGIAVCILVARLPS